MGMRIPATDVQSRRLSMTKVFGTATPAITTCAANVPSDKIML